MPRSSYYIKNNENDKFWELIRTAFQLLLCLALPSIIGLIGLQKEIILIFAGNEFLPASNVIALLSFNILIVGISNIVGIQILIPLGKEKITLYSVLFGGLIDICLSVILMPKLAETGAAISLVFTELGITLFQIITCKGILKNIKNYLPNIKPYVIGSIGIILILFMCNRLISNIIYKTIISILLSIVEYFAVLYISKDKIILSLLGKMNLQHKKS
jgi:O-antigen/teichoic acid export membrane protein